jgi:hypothetical protein
MKVRRTPTSEGRFAVCATAKSEISDFWKCDSVQFDRLLLAASSECCICEGSCRLRLDVRRQHFAERLFCLFQDCEVDSYQDFAIMCCLHILGN